MKLKLMVTQGDRILNEHIFDADQNSITVYLPINIEVTKMNYKTGKEEVIPSKEGIPVQIKFERTKDE